MYVNLKEYEQRLADYQKATRLYEQRAEGHIDYNFEAEGYRPPSVLSIFCVGLEHFLPNKIVTTQGGLFRASNESGINNPQSLLFGKVDLLFNVSFVISLLALIFTFSTITGEKEEGTLRLVMSNPVPRWQMLVAKIIGNYVILLVPFLLSILIALIVLNTSGIVPIFSAKILLPFLVVLFITLLFILAMFNLGILVSTLTHRSITSLVALLFVWTVLVLSLPKISPMIADILHPVKSVQVVELEKSLVRENLARELRNKRAELYNKIVAEYALENPFEAVRAEAMNKSEKGKKVEATYFEAVKVLEQQYEQRINEETRKIEQEWDNHRNAQAAIAMNLSRMSPVSCYSYIVSGISGTGVPEVRNLIVNAGRFQDEVKANLYDNFIVRWYGNYVTTFDFKKGFYPQKAPVPQLNYRHTTLSEALQAEWVDIILLLLFNIAFFAASYVSFLRYDVR